jgi:2-hydroxymuconate-semialdehyde hydrolase
MTRVHDVAVGDYNVRVAEAGDRSNPTIVFLHGSGPGATGLSNWQHIVSEMADEFHCLAPDVLGFGDSSHPNPPPAGMRAFAELRAQTIIGLLDALGLQQVHLVGNSMGGMYTLLIAAQAPERVGSFILMGSGGAPVPPAPDIIKLVTFYNEPTAEKMADLMTAFVYDPAMFGDRLGEIAVERMTQASRDDVRRSHLATFDFAAGGPLKFDEEFLAGIPHRALLIHGRDDTMVSPENTAYFLKHLTNADAHLIGRCGHWTQIEHPEKFIGLARAFFSGRLP